MGISGINGYSGGINQANVAEMRGKMATKLMGAMDSDKSGAVSKDELTAFGEKMKAQAPKSGKAASMPSTDQVFASADANGDANLSVDELSSMMAQAETQMKAGGPKGSGGPPPGGPPPGGPPPGGPPPGGPPPGGPPPGGASGGAKANGSTSAVKEKDNSSSATDPADANKDGTVTAAEELIYSMTNGGVSTE